MKLLPARLNDKPQYVFHPLRMLRRARYAGPSTQDSRALAELPWGLPLEVYAHETIGFTILTTGVFDPGVSETLFRLIDAGDSVVDVGANVGYLTSLGAVRAGPAGSVTAFEPHPEVFGLLAANVERWQRDDIATVDTRQVALSDRSGTAALNVGPQFHANMGLASIAEAGDGPAGEHVPVALERLDDVIGHGRIGMLKIDVEGHETSVLRGATKLLEDGRIRDLVFEDHEPYPDASTELVEAAGYHLFSISNDLFGVTLGAPSERGETAEWPGPSYLATRDPERALARLRPRGWWIPGIGPTAPWKLRRRRGRAVAGAISR
jgi:FkbM family methyltransferase